MYCNEPKTSHPCAFDLSKKNFRHVESLPSSREEKKTFLFAKTYILAPNPSVSKFSSFRAATVSVSERCGDMEFVTYAALVVVKTGNIRNCQVQLSVETFFRGTMATFIEGTCLCVFSGETENTPTVIPSSCGQCPLDIRGPRQRFLRRGDLSYSM